MLLIARAAGRGCPPRETISLFSRSSSVDVSYATMRQDSATGKGRDHDILTSVLRDTWERILVRDVATAGGVDEKQVILAAFTFGASRANTQSIGPTVGWTVSFATMFTS